MGVVIFNTTVGPQQLYRRCDEKITHALWTSQAPEDVLGLQGRELLNHYIPLFAPVDMLLPEQLHVTRQACEACAVTYDVTDAVQSDVPRLYPPLIVLNLEREHQPPTYQRGWQIYWRSLRDWLLARHGLENLADGDGHYDALPVQMDAGTTQMGILEEVDTNIPPPAQPALPSTNNPWHASFAPVSRSTFDPATFFDAVPRTYCTVTGVELPSEVQPVRGRVEPPPEEPPLPSDEPLSPDEPSADEAVVGHWSAAPRPPGITEPVADCNMYNTVDLQPMFPVDNMNPYRLLVANSAAQQVNGATSDYGCEGEAVVQGGVWQPCMNDITGPNDIGIWNYQGYLVQVCYLQRLGVSKQGCRHFAQ